MDTARKNIKLVFARLAKAQHPDLRFCHAVPCDWDVLSESAVTRGRFWGSDTEHRSSGALIVVLCSQGEVVDVETLPEKYVGNVPSPQVPKTQRALSHQVNKIPDYYKALYILPMYETTRSIVESAAYAFSPAWHAIAINT
jgi:hypothetical protein